MISPEAGKYENPILNEREKTHGSFQNVAGVAQGIKDVLNVGANLAHIVLSPVQAEALNLIATKLARICCGNPNEPDHWKDIAGYAQLAEHDLESRKV